MADAVLTFVVNSLWQVPLAAFLALLLERAWGRSSGRDGSGLLLAAMFASALLPMLALAIAPSAPRGPLVLPADIRSPEAPAWMVPAALDRPMPAPFSADVAGVLAAGFGLFVALRLASILRSWNACRRLVRQARVTPSPRLLEAARECAARLGVSARVEVRISEHVDTPMTIGIWRAVIVWPSALAAAAPRVLAAVLAHEMVHVRRRDFGWNLAAEIVTAPVAFHPALWLLRRRLALVRETACDEHVCASGMSWRRYAGALLEVAASALRGRRPAPAMGLWGVSLEERILRLREGRGAFGRVSLRRRLAGGAALGSAVVLAAGFAVGVSASRVEAAVSGLEAMVASGEDSLRDLLAPSGETPRYDPTGRRDPFERRAPEPPRGVGLARFRIDEVALRGIVDTPSGRIALLWAPGQKTYFARVGQVFFDGRLVAIAKGAALLRQHPTALGSGGLARTVRLALHEDAGTVDARK